MNLNEIKEALSKATPGQWKGKHAIKPYITVFTGVADEVIATVEMRNNLQLLSNAPEWLASLVNQIERMQKTLEWYADKENWNFDFTEMDIPAANDEGERARQALKGVEAK